MYSINWMVILTTIWAFLLAYFCHQFEVIHLYSFWTSTNLTSTVFSKPLPRFVSVRFILRSFELAIFSVLLNHFFFNVLKLRLLPLQLIEIGVLIQRITHGAQIGYKISLPSSPPPFYHAKRDLAETNRALRAGICTTRPLLIPIWHFGPFRITSLNQK